MTLASPSWIRPPIRLTTFNKKPMASAATRVEAIKSVTDSHGGSPIDLFRPNRLSSSVRFDRHAAEHIGHAGAIGISTNLIVLRLRLKATWVALPGAVQVLSEVNW
jgi:hypothetical protein